jgi:2,3-bisphosphoglycerate-dependent phosphoglycerate mutase
MWNQLNLFCGWIDVPLSLKGIEEAREAGRSLKGVTIDLIFTSQLERAMETALIAMAEYGGKRTPYVIHEGGGEESRWSYPPHDLVNQSIPILRSAALNERMYGELQGLNKDEARVRFGEEQVHRWRRSYDEAPPGGESLKLTAERTLPYFRDVILPRVREGKNVLVAAHGNSLRSIIMDIEAMTPDQIIKFELETGRPRIYETDGQTFQLERE